MLGVLSYVGGSRIFTTRANDKEQMSKLRFSGRNIAPLTGCNGELTLVADLTGCAMLCNPVANALEFYLI
jgi:hypothetical protein